MGIRSLLVYSLLAQLYSAVWAVNVVPVLLWSGQSSSPSLINPLHKTSRSEFEALLSDRLGKNQPPMLVFVKDNFCIEDIKHHKESLQQLNDVGTLTCLTSVESALHVFENLLSYNVTLEDNIDSLSEAQLAVVQTNDLNAIPEIYSMIRESSPNLIVALTGKSCAYSSLERVRRAAGNKLSSTESLGLRIQNKGVLFYSNGYPRVQLNSTIYQLSAPTFVNPVVNKTHQDLSMNFSVVGDKAEIDKITLTAYFRLIKGYTILKHIGFRIDGKEREFLLKSKQDIYFPNKFSYHCGLDSIFTYKSESEAISIIISNIQVQTNATVFGDAYDCIGFMSIPIWTGIFVTAILALIMIWGLTMIMDIRTMDRFDDPKGKTITISAQE